MTQRFNKYIKWERTIGENIMYNSRTPFDALVSLAIDDGVPSRGHRVNIFKADFAYMGCATAMHRGYTSETVVNYMGAWKKTPYAAPKIAVPKVYAGFKGYGKWNAPPSCAATAMVDEYPWPKLDQTLLVEPEPTVLQYAEAAGSNAFLLKAAPILLIAAQLLFIF